MSQNQSNHLQQWICGSRFELNASLVNRVWTTLGIDHNFVLRSCFHSHVLGCLPVRVVEVEMEVLVSSYHSLLMQRGTVPWQHQPHFKACRSRCNKLEYLY